MSYKSITTIALYRVKYVMEQCMMLYLLLSSDASELLTLIYLTKSSYLIVVKFVGDACSVLVRCDTRSLGGEVPEKSSIQTVF